MTKKKWIGKMKNGQKMEFGRMLSGVRFSSFWMGEENGKRNSNE